MKPAPQDSTAPSASPNWCATCGHAGALGALARALVAMRLPEERLVCVSGPGCAGKLPRGMRGYRLEVPAGLTLTVAAGLAMQRRDLSVVAIAGDMEARTAGLLALHAVGKRGPKLLYLILDNGIAAQSAGSFSEALPVAGAGCLELCIQANFAFVASGIAADTESAATFIREAMEFEGSAAVVLRSACTTFHDEGSDLAMRASMQAVPREHPADDALGALSLARRSDVVWSGVLLKRRRS